MKKHLILAACAVAGSLQAQFQYSYGTIYNEATPAVSLTTTDNGYISAGRTDRPTYGNVDATLIKTNAAGTQVWSRIYGGQGVEQFNSVKETPGAALRYVAVGSSTSFTGTSDAYLVGTDVNGVPLLSKTYGGTREDRFNHIQKIVHPVDGPGYIIVGESNSFGHFGTGFDIYVVRIDLAGNIKASAVLGYTGDQFGHWIEPTGDGYIIAGSTTVNCTPSATGLVHSDIYAVKLDHNLNLVWDRIVGNNNVLRNDVAYCVKVDNVGDYVFTGETHSYGPVGGNSFLLKLTSAGGPVFFRTYSGPVNDQGRSLLVHKTSTGVFYVVAGYSNSYNPTNNPDAFVYKTDQLGNLVWARVYGKERPDYAYEINFSSTLQNGYVVAGHEMSFGAGAYDAYLIRTDLNGNSGSNCIRAVYPVVQTFAPCLFKSTKVIPVSVEKIVNTPSYPLLYIHNKCTVPVAAREDNAEDLELSQAVTLSPNPAKSQVNFNIIADLKGSSVSIKDLDGRNVMNFELENEVQTVSIEGLHNGLYMVVITQPDGKVLKEKLLIQD